MSNYADYRVLSASYDQTRDAVGLALVLGCLAVSGRPLAKQRVLDAGCGTGNYSRALLEHVGRVEGVDASEEMLQAAAVKLGDAVAVGRARLHRGDLASLPLDEASVDAVVVNQVLHHLEPGRSDDWPVLDRVMREFRRVLVPGGALVVNLCSHRQIRHGFWYARLIPAVVEAMCARHPTLEQLEAAMDRAGLEPRQRLVPVDALMQGRHYHEPLGPTRPEWRAGDSMWSLLEAQELEAVQARVLAMEAEGTLGDYVAEADRLRPDIGQVTFVHAVRRAA